MDCGKVRNTLIIVKIFRWSLPLNSTSNTPLIRKFINFFDDKEYYQKIIRLGLPIVFLQFIFASLNLISNIMVGQLGDTAIAAVALAGQIFFLLNLLIFGISSGAAMFTAQLWGKRDIENIHRVLGLALLLGLGGSLIFLFISTVFPAYAISIYSKDPAVIALGSQYLRISSWSFIFFTISATYALVLRSTGNVRLPVFVTISILILSIILSYVLIFGKYGAPKLGVIGAALALLISRILECGLLLYFTYRLKMPAAAPFHHLVNFNREFAITVLKPILPVAINEILWSLGITTYNIIYARMGTESIAAINIASTLDMLAMVLFIGIGNATAILVGNFIGSDRKEIAYDYSGRSLRLGILGGIIIAGILFLISPWVLSQYKVSLEVLALSQKVIYVNCIFLWIRTSNMILFIGVLRAGGDTRFALILDGLIIWVVGVPMAYIGAFVLALPVYYVFLMTISEEFLKWFLGTRRYVTKKWIHDLTVSMQAIE